MRKLRNFKCLSGVIFERFADDNQVIAKCKCGGVANKIASAGKYFKNTTGKSPSL